MLLKYESVLLNFNAVTWTLRQVENDDTAEFKLDVQRQVNGASSGDFMQSRGMLSIFTYELVSLIPFRI